MHAHAPVPLGQFFDSTSAVSFTSLEPGLMVGTPSSTFDSSAPTVTRTYCQFAAHRVFVVLDGVYRVMQILTFLAWTANGRQRVSLGCGSGVQVLSDSMVWPCNTSASLFDRSARLPGVSILPIRDSRTSKAYVHIV